MAVSLPSPETNISQKQWLEVGRWDFLFGMAYFQRLSLVSGRVHFFLVERCWTYTSLANLQFSWDQKHPENPKVAKLGLGLGCRQEEFAFEWWATFIDCVFWASMLLCFLFVPGVRGFLIFCHVSFSVQCTWLRTMLAQGQIQKMAEMVMSHSVKSLHDHSMLLFISLIQTGGAENQTKHLIRFLTSLVWSWEASSRKKCTTCRLELFFGPGWMGRWSTKNCGLFLKSMTLLEDGLDEPPNHKGWWRIRNQKCSRLNVL